MSSRKDKVVADMTTAEASLDNVPPVATKSERDAMPESKPDSSTELISNPQLGLIVCPQCGQTALFWNRHERIYKCVNPECKKQFTLGDYQNREEGKLADRLQTEQGPTSVPAMELTDKPESATAEEIPSSGSTTVATEETQPTATGQIQPNELISADRAENSAAVQLPSNEPIGEVKSEVESGVKPVPSKESITGAKDEMEIGAAEQILSNLVDAKRKDGLGRGKIEETSHDVPTPEVQDAGKEGAKAVKQMNRNLALILTGILVAGIVILGLFLGQKSGDLNELSSQLTKSREALTASQAQLAASRQDVEGLRTQLTQAQQEIVALQAEIDELKPLIPSEPFVYSGELSGGDSISIPIELKQSERVEGTVAGGLGGLAVYIQDSSGNVVEDLGRIFRSSFTLTAPTSGIYTMILTGPSGLTCSYTINFTIYGRQ